MRELASNPEIMKAMMNPKLQDIMKANMTDGPEAVVKMVANDPELKELIDTLGKIMPDLGGGA